MKSIAIATLLVLSIQMKTNNPIVVVANEKQNILVIGVDNPLDVLIEDASKNSIILKTDNGVIQKSTYAQFTIHPAIPGLATIKVCQVIKKDTIVIGTKDFIVHRLPDPEAVLGQKKGGPIKKSYLMAQQGIRSYINCCGFDAPVQVTEYTFIAIRDSSTIGISRNIGAKYTDKSVELLNRLQQNDQLLVYKLSCKTPDGIVRPLDPMEFSIEE